MQERNFVRKEKFCRRSRRQNKDREGNHSAHHLSERRCRFIRPLFRTRELRRNCWRQLTRFAAIGMQLETREAEIQKFYERPAAIRRLAWSDHEVRWLNRAMR